MERLATTAVYLLRNKKVTRGKLRLKKKAGGKKAGPCEEEKKNLKKIPNRGNAPSRSRCLPGIVFVLYIFCRAPSLSMSRRLLATGHPTPLCHPIDLISKSSGFFFFACREGGGRVPPRESNDTVTSSPATEFRFLVPHETPKIPHRGTILLTYIREFFK